MIGALARKFFGSSNDRRVKGYRARVDAINASFGSVETYLTDFKAAATMRGIGWAITFQDPTTGLLSNHWVTLHNDGNPAGYKPVLVMDAWEHAFVPDYKPTERAKYVEAYFQNIDWKVAAERVS